MEHHSNIVPWHFLRERHGAVIKWAPVDEDGNFLLDEFEKLLTPRTKMVAMTHMSNALGTIVPIKEVVRIAHARGIPVLVDGSQAAVHLDIDVQDIGCDFYAITGHKLYGPTGIGALYGKYEHLAAMRPFNGGGEMIKEVFEDRVIYGEPPHKFEAGTPPIVQAIGLGAAIDYVQSIGKARIRAHENDVVKYAHQRLREINSLRIIGTAKDKGAIVSFELKSAHPHDVATIIDRAGVAVRAGTHCAMPLLARYGVTATCRASFGLYNTKAEVDTPGPGLDQGTGHVRMTDETKTADAPAPNAVETSGGSAIPAEELGRITDDIVGALKTVYDPEIPADIYELGLIYKVDIADDRAVTVDMTLTTPNCPSAQELPIMVENAVSSVAGVGPVTVNVVWDPPWEQSRMSDEARAVAEHVVRSLRADPIRASPNRQIRRFCYPGIRQRLERLERTRNGHRTAPTPGDAADRCRRRSHQGDHGEGRQADRRRARRREERRLRRHVLHDGICRRSARSSTRWSRTRA